MNGEGKWSRRAKWIVSSFITVLFMVLICSIVLNTMQTVEEVQASTDNDSDTTDSGEQVPNNLDDVVRELPVEEATVFYLLRIDGYGLTVDDVSNIPAGCDSGTLSMAISDTINNLSGDTKVVLNLEHQRTRDLPAPSIVWIDNGENSYPVVFLYQDTESVTVSDPNRGTVKYPISEFDAIYRNAGSQSVYISDRGYIIK